MLDRTPELSAMGGALARVLDPGALDDAPGPRGHLRVDVVESWLTDGAVVEIVVPARLTCARCDGGGCDGCDRSGALRLAGDDHARTLRLALPRGGGDSEARRLLLRLVRPLDDEPALAQLWVELRSSPEASAFCRRISAVPPSRGPRGLTPAIGAAVAVLAAIVLALLASR